MLAFSRMLPVLNEQGVLPAGEETAGVAVFAIYDKEQKIQYIGFSSNVGKSIEKLFYRRPAVTYFFKFPGTGGAYRYLAAVMNSPKASHHTSTVV